MAFRDEEYILIQGWMINRLKLKGNDLLVYALLYGFSQDGNHKFYGTLQYLAEWTNSTVSGIQRNLDNLINRNLIFKSKGPNSRNEYWINLEEIQQSCSGIQQSCNEVQQSCNGIQQSCNNNNNKNTNKKIFKNELFPEPVAPIQETLDPETYFDQHRRSKSLKVLSTWIGLYVEDQEKKEQLQNWLSIMYGNKKITTLEGLKNKIICLEKYNLTREEELVVIRDAADRTWFGFQWSVENLKKNAYNMMNSNIAVASTSPRTPLQLADEVF